MRYAPHTAHPKLDLGSRLLRRGFSIPVFAGMTGVCLFGYLPAWANQIPFPDQLVFQCARYSPEHDVVSVSKFAINLETMSAEQLEPIERIGKSIVTKYNVEIKFSGPDFWPTKVSFDRGFLHEGTYLIEAPRAHPPIIRIIELPNGHSYAQTVNQEDDVLQRVKCFEIEGKKENNAKNQ